MLILYHCISARSFRVLWLLEELQLPYDLRMLAFPPRAHDKAFVELNPRGTVTLFIDGETRMTESAAICEYLALRHSPGEMSVAANELHMEAMSSFASGAVRRNKTPNAVPTQAGGYCARSS